MSAPLRPIAFVLAASNHGSMIVNRNDYSINDFNPGGYGVCFQILSTSSYDSGEVDLLMTLLNCRRRHFGDGVVAVDGGANIGVHTVEWARMMYGWGQVMAFEAQEVVFYALAGNVVLNNCLNARVKLAALGEKCGELAIPQPDYYTPSSFGSLELRPRGAETEYIGQKISYEKGATGVVPMVNLDSLKFDRLDFLKIDVEGMELDVLRGAHKTLSRHHPILFMEFAKSDPTALENFVVKMGYQVFGCGMNMLAIHKNDPTLNQIKLSDGNQLTLEL